MQVVFDYVLVFDLVVDFDGVDYCFVIFVDYLCVGLFVGIVQYCLLGQQQCCWLYVVWYLGVYEYVGQQMLFGIVDYDVQYDVVCFGIYVDF